MFLPQRVINAVFPPTDRINLRQQRGGYLYKSNAAGTQAAQSHPYRNNTPPKAIM